MKQFTLIFLCLLFIDACSRETKAPPLQGARISAPDGLYEFTVPEGWKERANAGPNIEKMFISPDNAARFFVLRIPNPPHTEIKEPQLSAYADGLNQRYQNVQFMMKETDQKDGKSIGKVIFTYDEETPRGPLTIRNFCEVIIHKNNYLDVCAVSPAAVWEQKRFEMLRIFPTLTLK